MQGQVLNSQGPFTNRNIHQGNKLLACFFIMEVSNSKIAGKIQMVDGELMTERDQELLARRCLIGQMNKG